MTKKYQTEGTDTSALAVPEQVNVAMSEIVEDMREGLLALAVGAGLQVMQSLMEADVAAQLMEADVSAVCGPRGKYDPQRAATRHGTEAVPPRRAAPPETGAGRTPRVPHRCIGPRR